MKFEHLPGLHEDKLQTACAPTSVTFPVYSSLIGSLSPPDLVLIFSDFLSTICRLSITNFDNIQRCKQTHFGESDYECHRCEGAAIALMKVHS